MHLQSVDGTHSIAFNDSRTRYEILELEEQSLQLGLYVIHPETQEEYMKVRYELEPIED